MRSKRDREDIAEFLFHLEENIDMLLRNRLKKVKSDYENCLIPMEKVTQSIQSSIAFLDFGNSEKVKQELLRNYVLC